MMVWYRGTWLLVATVWAVLVAFGVNVPSYRVLSSTVAILVWLIFAEEFHEAVQKRKRRRAMVRVVLDGRKIAERGLPVDTGKLRRGGGR